MFLRVFLPLLPSLILFLCTVGLPVSPHSFYLTNTSTIERDVACRRGDNVICLGGTADMKDGGLWLTPQCQSNTTGWAYYSDPLHLWDSSTGKLASFSTSFSMDMNSCGNTMGGIAGAFFLSPYPYQIPPNSWASHLGMIGVNSQDISGIAAVMFHRCGIYATPHFVIDINSSSVDPSNESMMDVPSQLWNAAVRYEAHTQSLSVVYFGAINRTQIMLTHVVDLSKLLPEWVVVGISGISITDTAGITSWEFSSITPDSTIENRKHSRVGLHVVILIGVGITIAVVTAVLFFLWKRGYLLKKRKYTGTSYSIKNIASGPPQASANDKSSVEIVDEGCYSIDKEIDNDKGPHRFTYGELVTATTNFSDNQKLGAGGFGSVYKGYLQNLNIEVAVKKSSKDSKQGAKEYISEVKIINRLRHKNLVRLIGWCHEYNNLLLVYDFMPNGSLDYHLFGMEMPILSWSMRYNVALGVASALSYLHTGWEQCVLHRDVKTSNIMLDANFSAKLGDFGLARLVEHRSRAQTTTVVGTPGYIAPEYFFDGKYSKESDIYSFGIVLLEIISGKSANDSEIKGGNNKLVDWVWNMYKDGGLLEVADPRLEGEFDRDQMERLIVVGLWCANLDLNARPSMQQAMASLNFDAAPMPYLSRESTATFFTENRKPQISLSPTSTCHSSTIQSPAWSTSYSSMISSNDV